MSAPEGVAPGLPTIEPMRIERAETFLVEIPFELKGSGVGIMPTTWNSLDFALVRLTDDRGNVGWGEGFGYQVAAATRLLMERLVLPTLVGEVVDDIAAWNLTAQRKTHLFGRFGGTVFAIGGVDIALWDLAARRAGLPLAELLSDAPLASASLPFYGSLVRYGEDALVREAVARSQDEGFARIKLHEVEVPLILAARETAPDASIAADINCAWSAEFVDEHRDDLVGARLEWLEEPVFPPEDFAALAAMRGGPFPIAAGENLSTARQCAQMLSAGAVDVFQPSPTKVGGLSETWRALDMGAHHGVRLCPHTPYFGPGMHVALHMAAARSDVEALEWLFVDPEAWITDVPGLRTGDTVRVPDGPGIGFEPDMAVIERYAARR